MSPSKAKTKLDYEQILKDLNQTWHEQRDLGDLKWKLTRIDFNKLQKWMNGGRAGRCPVELSAYGYGDGVAKPRPEPVEQGVLPVFEGPTLLELTETPINPEYPVEPAPTPVLQDQITEFDLEAEPPDGKIQKQVAEAGFSTDSETTLEVAKIETLSEAVTSSDVPEPDPQPIEDVSPLPDPAEPVEAGGALPILAELDDFQPPAGKRINLVNDQTELTQPGLALAGIPKAVVETSPEETSKLVSVGQTVQENQRQKRIEELSLLVEKEQWRDAINLASVLLLDASLSEQERSQVRILQDRGRNSIDRIIKDSLEKAETALQRGDDEALRQMVAAAQALDQDHPLLVAFQNRQLRETISILTETKRNELRRGLRERTDMKRLEDTIRTVEALRAEDNLPEDLREMLIPARAHFDAVRTAHGQVTSQARFGDVAAREQAVREIQKHLTEKPDQSYFDANSGRWRPVFEVLKEAQEYYNQESKKAVQEEINLIKNLLPRYPDGALERLKKALETPYAETQRKMLENLRQEIDDWMERREAAQTLIKQATVSCNAVERFSLLLRAQNSYAYLEGLEDTESGAAQLVDQARLEARSMLKVQMSEALDRARTSFRLDTYEGYAQARKDITAARQTLAHWPENKPPSELSALELTAEALQGEIQDREVLHRQFDEERKRILSAIEKTSPKERAKGMAHYQRLRTNPTYASFEADLRVLESELDSYKGVQQWLDEARENFDRQDWKRVIELAQRVEHAEGAQLYIQDARRMRKESARRLGLEEVRRRLKLEEVRQASDALNALLASDLTKDERDSIQAQLKAESEQIADCLKASPPFLPILRQARELALRQGVKERLQALRLYRFLAGENIPDADKDWPAYTLNIYTADARVEFRKLADELRSELFSNLKSAYRERNAHTQGQSLAHLAAQARALRDGQLLESEEERSIVAWIDLVWAETQAEARTAVQNWEGLVAIWEDMHGLYPLSAEVETHLRQARILQGTYSAEQKMNNGQADLALIEIRGLQKDPALNRSWQIAFTLSQIYCKQGNFNFAFQALADARRFFEASISSFPEAEAKRIAEDLDTARSKIEREQAIVRELDRSEQEVASRRPREALRILHEAMEKPLLQDSNRLRRKQEEIFSNAKDALLLQYHTGIESTSLEGRIQAVCALVDLLSLEDMAGYAGEESRARKELALLSDGLTQAAETVIKAARFFTPEDYPLEKAITEIGVLLSRLESFGLIEAHFPKELHSFQEDILRHRKNLADLQDKLMTMKIRLDEANQSDLWDMAVRKDDFTPLEQKKAQMDRLNLGMTEFFQLKRCLEEWKEVHRSLNTSLHQAYVKFAGEEEDFEGVVRLLRNLKGRPARLENGENWLQVQQQDYERIRQIMSIKVQISDPWSDGSHLMITGWDEFEQVADERRKEYAIWETFRKAGEALQEGVSQCLQKVDHHKPDTNQLRKRQDWEQVRSTACEAVSHWQMVPAGIHSLKAEAVDVFRQDSLEQAQGWQSRAEKFLCDPSNNEKFPTLKEFRECMDREDVERLNELLLRARRVGPSNEKEDGWIRVYTEELETMRNQTPGFWKEIFQRLFGRG